MNFSTLPSIFLYNPKVIFAVVDFPDPFGPIKVIIFPFLISKETPLTSHFSLTSTPAFSNFTSV